MRPCTAQAPSDVVTSSIVAHELFDRAHRSQRQADNLDRLALLFRDIEPDRFYPIYGDSSVRGFDAQSTSRLYARLDHGASHFMYGDFTTRSSDEAVDLGGYSRSLSGLKGRWETDLLTVDGFASQDDAQRSVEELPGRGIAGPYELGSPDVLPNSEQVELVTRDRSQPSRVIETRTMSRFAASVKAPQTGRETSSMVTARPLAGGLLW